MPRGYALSNRELDPRLVNRLLLNENPTVQDPYILFRNIVPVTQVDALLKEITGASDGEVAPTATGFIAIYTVPDGKRATLYAVDCTRTTGAAEEISSFSVRDSSLNINVRLTTFTAAASHQYSPPTPIPMDQADEVMANVSTHNAGDKITGYVWIEEEDAYQLA